MKYILIILLSISSVAFGQSRITIKNGSGGSGSATFSGQFDIRAYGADTSLADNTAYIQAAINAAHHYGQRFEGNITAEGLSGGGVVTIPSGTFLTKKLTSYEDVQIKGQGYISSSLKSIEADTMIVIHQLNNALVNTPYNAFTNTLIEDVMLDGDSVGTVGFYADRLANFRIGRTFIKEFMSNGLILKNSLIGVVDNCYLYKNPTGIKAFISAGLDVCTNLIVLRDCSINLSKNWGIDWKGGGMLKVDHGDMEGNGTAGDTLSGSIFYHDNIWPGGLTVDHTWFEGTYGTTIAIVDNNTPANDLGWGIYNVHNIISTQDLGSNVAGVIRNLYLRGVNNKLSIIGSVFGSATKTIVSDGSAVINVMGTYIASTTMRGGATIITVGN